MHTVHAAELLHNLGETHPCCCWCHPAGTENGIADPQATFSACYAGAFIMWHPLQYAALLADKMQQQGCQAWLLNTGGGSGRDR
jgi:ATP-dependent phosphoenolpyruvate carboxykinase